MVFDRDKVRSQGVDLSQAGQDLSTMLGGNYVNRFSIQGRSYKVIPQVKRAERLTPDQLEHIYVTGSENKLVRCRRLRRLKTTTEPRALKKFQQLNAVTNSGRDSAGRAAGQGSDACLRTRPRRSCRRASRSTTRVNRGSCVWKAASSSELSCCRHPDLPGAGGAV